jgi:hypothetical protein
MRCAMCRNPVAPISGLHSERVWCSDGCCDAWYSARPEEAARWRSVASMTPAEIASLEAALGLGQPC